MSPKLTAVAQRRTSLDAREIVDAVVFEVAQRMVTDQASFPASWFAESQPSSEDEVRRFHGFVWTVCRRRELDAIRKRYVERSFQAQHEPEVDETRRNEARQILDRLASAVNAMPSHDRELLVRYFDTGGPPMPPDERMRVSRLRRKLARAIGYGDDEES